MDHIIRLVGPNQAVEILGVKLVGVSAESGKKLLFSLVFVALAVMLGRLLRAAAGWYYGRREERVAFWVRQVIRLATAGVLLLGLVSIWFDDPVRLATAIGLVTAGLAFALQKVVTAVAGYFVILRGNTFNVGDRIRMGGVRGDVIALDFINTTIMEMGQPPAVQADDPAMWVQSRQFTGRLVTVSNAVIFDEPVYNYSREFPWIWEELKLPIPYKADRGRAERILLGAADRLTRPFRQLSADDARELQRRYFMTAADTAPHVYYRLTDNWLELTVRFVAATHGVRELKDQLSREVLRELDEAGIGLASATFEIVGLPPLRVRGAGGGQLAGAGGGEGGAA